MACLMAGRLGCGGGFGWDSTIGGGDGFCFWEFLGFGERAGLREGAGPERGPGLWSERLDAGPAELTGSGLSVVRDFQSPGILRRGTVRKDTRGALDRFAALIGLGRRRIFARPWTARPGSLGLGPSDLRALGFSPLEVGSLAIGTRRRPLWHMYLPYLRGPCRRLRRLGCYGPGG